MPTALRRSEPVTIEAFDDFVAAQADATLFELVEGVIVMMTNPTEVHEQITANIGAPLKLRHGSARLPDLSGRHPRAAFGRFARYRQAEAGHRRPLRRRGFEDLRRDRPAGRGRGALPVDHRRRSAARSSTSTSRFRPSAISLSSIRIRRGSSATAAESGLRAGGLDAAGGCRSLRGGRVPYRSRRIYFDVTV